MSRHGRSNRHAVEQVAQRDSPAWFVLLAISCIFIVPVLAIVGFRLESTRVARYQEENWSSAIATIEDVRMKPVVQTNGTFGGAMLYQVDVLASFIQDGAHKARWITVDNGPERFADADRNARVWKGKQYFVRWNPTNSKQITIAIN
jgi:hypothetical protein